METLPFGKRVSCGNFYVLKHTRALGRKELKELRARSGTPGDVRKRLRRGVLPCITVGTTSDSWRVEFSCVMEAYRAIDGIPVTVGPDGKWAYGEEDGEALAAIISGWFAYTSTVGDEEYRAEVLKALWGYIGRASEGSAPSAGEESLAAADEEARRGRASEVLLSGLSD